MHLLARASEVCFAVEVGGFNNQRVAFPMAAGVSHPLPDVLCQMRTPVDWNDPRIMDLLVEDHDVAGHLDQLEIVVVAGRRHGRTTVGPHDTALRYWAVFRALGWTLVRLIEYSHSLFRVGRERRNPAVGRIDH